MFALTDLESFQSVNLKCAPEVGAQLREQYASVLPGYHMNKKHWNTVAVNKDAGDKLIMELIDHSYDLVFASLPKKIKIELEGE